MNYYDTVATPKVPSEQRGNGTVRIVPQDATCSSTEMAVEWNQEGPQGDRGHRSHGRDRSHRFPGARRSGRSVGGGEAWFTAEQAQMTVPSNLVETVVRTLTLPAGSYVLEGAVVASNNEEDWNIRCGLEQAGALLSSGHTRGNEDITGSISVQWAVTLAGPTVIDLTCSTNTDDTTVNHRSLIATKVATLH